MSIAFALSGLAQGKYLVTFADKDGVSFDPYEYFDQKAIDRREKHGIRLDHYTDRPVRADYIDKVSEKCDSVKMVTRWLNGVVCYVADDRLDDIRGLSFVTSIKQLDSYPVLAMHGNSMPEGQKRLMKAQIDRMEGRGFHENGFTGKGVRVAIFDAGFPNVDRADEFMHIRARNGIIKTWDFVSKKEDVYRKHTHGTMVLSNIAGVVDEEPMGMAIDAEFLLARTERIISETKGEEENWLAAAEWADKNGADVINSSLGYTGRRYFQSDLDGEKSLVARAADMAAGKGIVVVNSAGNEGDVTWKTLGAPADADSILTVGGINPWTNIHTQWSSYGPSADGRLKPNVCAYGHTVVRSSGMIEAVTGTSFSSPLTAGFVACVIQAKPELKNMEIIDLVQRSGDLYPYFDYAHGYGVPQATKAMAVDPDFNVTEPTFAIDMENSRVGIVIDEEDFLPAEVIVLDYKDPFESIGTITEDAESTHAYDYQFNTNASSPKSYRTRYFYVHFEGADGKLDWYTVTDVQQREVFEIDLEEVSGPGKLRFFYRGYMKEFNVK